MFFKPVSLGICAGGVGGRSRKISGGGAGRAGACWCMTSGRGGDGCGGRTSLIMSG